MECVVAEDWGWCITVKTQPLELRVACENVDESTTRWRVFAFAERSPLQWLRGSDKLKSEIAELRNDITVIVSSVPDVTDIVWEANKAHA